MLLGAIQDAFRQGGWGMYPTLAFGTWALIETVRQNGKTAPSYRTALGLSFATLLAGLLGTTSGFIRTLQYAADHPFEQQIRFVILGLSETLHNLALAIVMLMLASLAYAIGQLRHR